MNNFLDKEQRYKLLYCLIHFLIRAYVNYILKESGNDSVGSGSGNNRHGYSSRLFSNKSRIWHGKPSKSTLGYNPGFPQEKCASDCCTTSILYMECS